jgi:hypothetical protein
MGKFSIELTERQVQALASDALILAAAVKLYGVESDSARLKARKAADRVLKLLAVD